MKLKTDIHIPSSEKKIDHHQKVYLIGSCFSENMASKFNYHGFHVLSNSHGIIYNPVSIRESFYDLETRYEYELEDLVQDKDRFFSYFHHGCFDGKKPAHVLGNINETIQLHRSFIEGSQFVFITLGTAWVYIEKHTEEIVANCHKMPSSQFQKKLLSLAEIKMALETMMERIFSMNPSIQIVFTLSPVKHLKDGFMENQLSKSLLYLAIQESIGENVSYFPAYEIMNDDLRDYRFWSADMLHPNELAIEYIWDKFSATYFTSNTTELMNEVKKLQQFLSHRSLSTDENSMKQLENEKEQKKKELKMKFPQLNL